MIALKAGDRIRIKDRQDWYLPSGYKLAGARGQVFEVLEEPEGYVMVLLDEELTGIDKKVPLGFRLEAIEKVNE
jgi:hypothetical protein